MKSFKTSILFIFSVAGIFSFISCNELLPERSFARADIFSNQKNDEADKRAIKYVPILDEQRNMAMALMPVPTDWNFSNGQDPDVFMEGPNDLKIYHLRGDQFYYSDVPYINQSYKQDGVIVKPFEPIENTVQFLKNLANNDGGKLIRQYNLPQFEKNAYALDQQVFKATPERKTIQVIGTEWQAKDGIKFIIIVEQFLGETQYSYYWGYKLDIMISSDAVFDQAKQDFLNAKLNTKYNAKWIATTNNQMRQQAEQNQRDHEGRMVALKNYGNQIIAQGKAHDAYTTRNHQKFMDNLNDRITVTSPSSGQTYDVALGSNHYWINDQNQLITSDNANYNPNQSNYSSGNWEEAQINY